MEGNLTVRWRCAGFQSELWVEAAVGGIGARAADCFRGADYGRPDTVQDGKRTGKLLPAGQKAWRQSIALPG